MPNISSPCSARWRAPANVVEQPLDLGAGEVRVEEQAGPLSEQRLQAGGLQLVADRSRAAVLPDDGVGDWMAVAVPDDGRLTLVGDTDGGDVCRAGLRLRAAPRARSPVAFARSLRGRARPSPAVGIFARTAVVRWRRCSRSDRRGSLGRRMCPGRARERNRAYRATD